MQNKRHHKVDKQIPDAGHYFEDVHIDAEEKSLLVRAAVLQHTNLTEFVIRTAVATARAVIDQSERLDLSQRDSLQVLGLLDNPPEPKAFLGLSCLVSACFVLCADESLTGAPSSYIVTPSGRTSPWYVPHRVEHLGVFHRRCRLRRRRNILL